MCELPSRTASPCTIPYSRTSSRTSSLVSSSRTSSHTLSSYVLHPQRLLNICGVAIPVLHFAEKTSSKTQSIQNHFWICDFVFLSKPKPKQVLQNQIPPICEEDLRGRYPPHSGSPPGPHECQTASACTTCRSQCSNVDAPTTSCASSPSYGHQGTTFALKTFLTNTGLPLSLSNRNLDKNVLRVAQRAPRPHARRVPPQLDERTVQARRTTADATLEQRIACAVNDRWVWNKLKRTLYDWIRQTYTS